MIVFASGIQANNTSSLYALSVSFPPMLTSWKYYNVIAMSACVVLSLLDYLCGIVIVIVSILGSL